MHRQQNTTSNQKSNPTMHWNKVGTNGRLPKAIVKLRLFCFLLLVASALPACRADYHDWVEDFLDDRRYVRFTTVNVDNGYTDDVANRLANCEAMRIEKTSIYDESNGMWQSRTFQESTIFVLRRGDGVCELHQFSYRSTSSGGLGCSSSEGISTYKICYAGPNIDCELIEESSS